MKKINYLNFILRYQTVRLKVNSLLLKRTTILFILILLSLPGFAQLDKKTWIVGGSGTFSSTNYDFSSSTTSNTATTTNLQLSPNIGYFITNKFLIGLKSSLSWINNRGRYNIGDNEITKSTVVTKLDYGPFIRYYFLNKEKPFNILTDVSYQFGNLKFKESKEKGARNNFGVMIGPVIYFTPSVGMEFLMGYKTEREELTKSTATPPYYYTDIKKGFQFSLGFQIHLTKY